MIHLFKNNIEMYGPQLENIMGKILLLAEVAILAEEIEFAAKNANDLKRNQKSRFKRMDRSVKSPAAGLLFHYNSNHGSDKTSNDNDDEHLLGEMYHDAPQNDGDDIKRNTGTSSTWFDRQKFLTKFVKRNDKKVSKFIEARGESDFSEMETLLGGVEWDESNRTKLVSNVLRRCQNMFCVFICN
jgi:hypothetical protein